MTLPGTLLRALAGTVGGPHVLTGDATAGFAVDWTGRFQAYRSWCGVSAETACARFHKALPARPDRLACSTSVL